MAYSLKINGEIHSVDADGDTPLLWALRDILGLTGTKFGCGKALCGACTVHVDGAPTRSCAMPIDAIGNRSVRTIESIGKTSVERRVQAIWIQLDVPQCGYCQSGQIMSACALLTELPTPTEAEIDSAMAGNLCRCGTYPRIKAAIKAASASGRA